METTNIIKMESLLDIDTIKKEIHIVDFNNWTLFSPDNKYKVMHQDQIEITYNNSEIIDIKIISSKRGNLMLSGVFELDTKMIYGYNDKKKPYKIFTPFNKNFPKFLVTDSSVKSNFNKIISIEYISWQTEHPIGRNIEYFCQLDPRIDIGDIIKAYTRSLLFYNGYYQIKRKHNQYDMVKLSELYESSLNNLTYHKKPKYDFKLICNIDPPGCIDIDDVISLSEINSELKSTKIIGIHITDVLYVLKIFEQEYPDLLKNTHKAMFESDIYATVYPHGIKPYGIIPDIFVENFLTLNPLKKRYVWSIYIHINDQNQIINVEFRPEIIENKKSFTYDEAEHILQSYGSAYAEPYAEPYAKYLAIIAEFCEFYGRTNFPTIYATYENHLTNSHYLITILMSYANQYVGNYLSTDPLAIYRTTSESISEKKFTEESIHISSYSMNNPNNNIHKVMNLQSYTHYTSPIRRFVDQYIHLRLYKKMFGIDLINIKLSEKVINIINRSLKEMKMMGNLNKVLSLIDSSKTNNYHVGKLIGIKYNPITKRLYIKWVINDSIRISDTIMNPLIEIKIMNNCDKIYTMINRLNPFETGSNEIVFELGKKYKLNIKFILLNGLTQPKVSIEYFSL